MKGLVFGLIVLLINSTAFAWGERGHHTIGEAAAIVISDLFSETGERAAVGDFYKSRALAFGHLNNIPDISWRSQTNKQISKFNGPTHYIDLDVLFEKPTEAGLSGLPSNYSEMKIKYTKAQLDKAGSAPWRVKQMYDSALVLGRCLKIVDVQKDASFKKFVIAPTGDKIIKEISCPRRPNAAEVALAYAEVLGVMGHFIADLGQPYHNTKDYDGWDSEQGGIHAYFETDILQEMKGDLLEKVVQVARKKLTELSKTESAFQASLRLSLESFNLISKVQDLDRQFSLIEKSAGKKRARRESAAADKVQKAYEDLIVDRLGTSAAQLAVLFYKSWKESGAPMLRDRSRIEAPYPLDVGFIKPNYLD